MTDSPTPYKKALESLNALHRIFYSGIAAKIDVIDGHTNAIAAGLDHMRETGKNLNDKWLLERAEVRRLQAELNALKQEKVTK